MRTDKCASEPVVHSFYISFFFLFLLFVRVYCNVQDVIFVLNWNFWVIPSRVFFFSVIPLRNTIIKMITRTYTLTLEYSAHAVERPNWVARVKCSFVVKYAYMICVRFRKFLIVFHIVIMCMRNNCVKFFFFFFLKKLSLKKYLLPCACKKLLILLFVYYTIIIHLLWILNNTEPMYALYCNDDDVDASHVK